VALAEGPGAADAVAAARARAAAVEEHEGLGARGWKLGPWFGFVGPVRDRADPRSGPLYVTRLEDLHYCPWQAFLRRVLALEPVPDALAGLPDVTPLLLGDVVHAVLEEIVARAGAPVRQDLEALAGAAPVEVAWPEDTELRVLLDEAAQAAARREGIVLPGFARLLAARALPMVERARDLDWGPDREPFRVIGAELQGRLRLPPPRGRTLHFRVDRADAAEDGVRVLVDYKTGRSVSDHRRADTRRRKLLEQVASGRRLQAPLYAHAAGEGHYLFLKEDTEDDCARVVVRRDDEELTSRLHGALEALLDAWEAGVFPPRLLDPSLASEGAACAWCDVADACLRGDTGSRMRLARWLTKGEAPSEGPERVARRLAEQVGWKK
jgi:RecB family exonuclease